MLTNAVCGCHARLLSPLVAVAGFTEEMAKYLVGRRFRSKVSDGIGCKGVVASVSAAALGLAGGEHVAYALGFMSTMNPVAGILEGLFRAVVAIPLHVGTVCVIALRSASVSVRDEHHQMSRVRVALKIP